jgi:hypothetical protein
MDPDHCALTIPRSAQPKGFSPNLAFFFTEIFHFLGLLFLSTFSIFEVSWYPPHFSAFMYELCGKLLEGRDGIECEFIIGSDLD